MAVHNDFLILIQAYTLSFAVYYAVVEQIAQIGIAFQVVTVFP